MTASVAIARRSATPVVALISMAIFINYIDRGNLSIAAPLIKSELNISASQLGLLLTSFFITYVPMQLVVGWLVERYGGGRVLLAGFLLWSFATIVTGFAGGLGQLFACRLVLGVGESVTFPAMSKLLAENVNESLRGVANGVVQAGLSFGPAFGLFFGGLATAAFGWRYFFVGFGATSLVWALLWLMLAQAQTRESELSHARLERVPMHLILRQLPLWGASIGHFCSNFVLYFNITWVPYYLVRERHWTLPQMSVISGTAFVAAGVSVIVSGWVSDSLIRRGFSVTVVRKSCWVIGGTGLAGSLLACGYTSGVVAAAMLVSAGFFAGLNGLNTYVVSQTRGGPAACGRWTGVQNFTANIAGLVAPFITGVIVDATGSFTLPFTICAAFAFGGVWAWVFLTGPLVPIDWKAAERRYAGARS